MIIHKLKNPKLAIRLLYDVFPSFTSYPYRRRPPMCLSFFFFFNDTATTEIYTLPYTTLFRSVASDPDNQPVLVHCAQGVRRTGMMVAADRKSTRLNSSHVERSYAGFCLKKKNEVPSRECGPSERNLEECERATRARADLDLRVGPRRGDDVDHVPFYHGFHLPPLAPVFPSTTLFR